VATETFRYCRKRANSVGQFRGQIARESDGGSGGTATKRDRRNLYPSASPNTFGNKVPRRKEIS
jgi:hypothetical protein